MIQVEFGRLASNVCAVNNHRLPLNLNTRTSPSRAPQRRPAGYEKGFGLRVLTGTKCGKKSRFDLPNGHLMKIKTVRGACFKGADVEVLLRNRFEKGPNEGVISVSVVHGAHTASQFDMYQGTFELGAVD
jgi:hypothetical protein